MAQVATTGIPLRIVDCFSYESIGWWKGKPSYETTLELGDVAKLGEKGAIRKAICPFAETIRDAIFAMDPCEYVVPLKAVWKSLGILYIPIHNDESFVDFVRDPTSINSDLLMWGVINYCNSLKNNYDSHIATIEVGGTKLCVDGRSLQWYTMGCPKSDDRDAMRKIVEENWTAEDDAELREVLVERISDALMDHDNHSRNGHAFGIILGDIAFQQFVKMSEAGDS